MFLLLNQCFVYENWLNSLYLTFIIKCKHTKRVQNFIDTPREDSVRYLKDNYIELDFLVKPAGDDARYANGAKKSWLIHVQLLYSEKLNNQLVMEKN